MSAARKLRRSHYPRSLMAGLHRAGKGQCLLCGRPPVMMGVWVPDAASSRRLGAPPGKIRPVVYALCETCNRRPGSLTEAENKIIREAEAALRLPESN